jgi:hypothetical protein
MSSSQSRKARAQEEKVHRKLEREIPTLEFDFGSDTLAFNGPVIITDLTIGESHRQALVAAGQPLPPPVPCRFLIDTGADGCVVKHELADRAGLKLINPSSPLEGIGVDTTGRTYFGRIVFACDSQAVSGMTHTFAVDMEIESGDLQSNQIDGLLGRNALHQFELLYYGLTGKVIMRFMGKELAKRGFPLAGRKTASASSSRP